MKLPLLFCGCLLVLFSAHMALGQNLDWEQKMQDRMDRIQREMEAKQKDIQARADKIQQEAKDKQNQFNAQLQLIKQKCAKKQSNNVVSQDKQNTKNLRVSQNAQVVNGFQHIYEQTIDLTTNKVDGRYYGFEIKNPNAEPICGQLTFN